MKLFDLEAEARGFALACKLALDHQHFENAITFGRAAFAAGLKEAWIIAETEPAYPSMTHEQESPILEKALAEGAAQIPIQSASKLTSEHIANKIADRMRELGFEP